MSSVETEREHVSIDVENIGGIEKTGVTFEPGVTILAGRNATHRTSLLQAVMAGLGSERASLKADADEGRVRLEIGDEVYTRELRRHEGGIAFDGDPYLENGELADLFAFLLESNEARRTVALGGDLREIIMEPIDAEAIQDEIEQLAAEKRSVDEQIEQLDDLQTELPELEQEHATVESDIEDKRAELEDKRAELEDESADAEAAEEDQSELEARMADLQRKQSTLEQVEYRLESQRDSLDTLEEELASLEEQQSGLSDDETDDLDTISSEIQDLRERKQNLSSELNKLQSVIQFNEEMREGASQDIASTLRGDGSGAETVTDQLLEPSETLVCWTCGTEVEKDAIDETLERLRDLRQEKYTEQNEIESRLDELKRRRSEIQTKQRERNRVEDRLANVRSEIQEREAKIADLEDESAELEADIEEIEAEIEELEQQDRSEILGLHKEANQLELELEQLEDERDRLAQNIEEIEQQVARLDELEAEKQEIQSELTDLRTRIDQIEAEAVQEFNDHMETVLDILNYDNIERIWVERTERQVRDGRRKVDKTEFDLHLVRSTDDGVTYEDEFEHLSESEREVTGLVFALAGYLAHEVYEEVPLILLDSLEAVDSERIATLVDYIGEYADYLVVALLPEDAAALDSSYQRISDI